MVSPLFDAIERDQLCCLLDDLGPDAPTILGAWTTHDLVAHLVLRERDLLAAPGLVIPGAWARFAEQRRLNLKGSRFADLVASLRLGPPRGIFRLGLVRRVANLNEFFVHHEDVRRANGFGPRTNPVDEDVALFRNVGHARRMLMLRARGVGLDIEWAGTDKVLGSRRGVPTVRLRGLPGELLLYLFGRRDTARVEVDGSPEAVAAFEQRRRPWWYGTE
jgi:uncharacterized protein (TIGR03085 family)